MNNDFMVIGRIINEPRATKSGKSAFVTVATKKNYFEDKTDGNDHIFDILVVGVSAEYVLNNKVVGNLMLFKGYFSTQKQKIEGVEHEVTFPMLIANTTTTLTFSQKNQNQSKAGTGQNYQGAQAPRTQAPRQAPRPQNNTRYYPDEPVSQPPNRQAVQQPAHQPPQQPTQQPAPQFESELDELQALMDDSDVDLW